VAQSAASTRFVTVDREPRPMNRESSRCRGNVREPPKHNGAGKPRKPKACMGGAWPGTRGQIGGNRQRASFSASSRFSLACR